MTTPEQHRESHDPSPSEPYRAKLTTSLGHPIHPTQRSSTPAQNTVDGSTNTVLGLPARIDPNLPADPGWRIEDTTSVRPVVPVVARDLTDDDPQLREPLDLAEVREIESFAWEFSDDACNVTIAADDLIRLCRQTLRLDRELGADRKAIGVLGAAVGKVNALHQLGQ